MSEENISQEFSLKDVDETKKLIEEINQNEIMSKEHKKVYIVLNCIEQLLILISTVNGCVFIFAFASLVNIPKGITTYAIGLKICIIAARIKSISQ